VGVPVPTPLQTIPTALGLALPSYRDDSVNRVDWPGIELCIVAKVIYSLRYEMCQLIISVFF